MSKDKEPSADNAYEAKRLGLPQLAHDLYRLVEFWPLCFSDPEWAWAKPSSFVVSAEEVVENDDKLKTLKILTANNESLVLRLDEVESDDGSNTSTSTSRLSIIVSGQAVFTTTYHETVEFTPPDHSKTTSSASGVHVYIPGAWVEQLQSLHSQIIEAEEENQKETLPEVERKNRGEDEH